MGEEEETREEETQREKGTEGEKREERTWLRKKGEDG